METKYTDGQVLALFRLSERYGVEFRSTDYQNSGHDLPEGYVEGWVGGHANQEEHPTIYVGCSPEGDISS